MKRTALWISLSLSIHALLLIPLPRAEEPITIEVILRPSPKFSPVYIPDEKARGIQKEIQQAKEEGENGKAEEKSIKYANYFDRIAQNIAAPWRKDVSRISKLGKVKADVRIVLDKQGRVVLVLLLNPSGNSMFDAACLKAFRNNIFPNPPASLFDPDGKARLTWRFYVS